MINKQTCFLEQNSSNYLEFNDVNDVENEKIKILSAISFYENEDYRNTYKIDISRLEKLKVGLNDS